MTKVDMRATNKNEPFVHSSAVQHLQSYCHVSTAASDEDSEVEVHAGEVRRTNELDDADLEGWVLPLAAVMSDATHLLSF